MSIDRIKNEIFKGNLKFVKDSNRYELIYGDPYEYCTILRDVIKAEGRQHKYREMSLYLIKSGRDMHFKLNTGVPFLVDALLCRSSYEVIRELIKRGCDVNETTEDGYTPLVYASQMNSDKRIVCELINNGANVNYRDFCGRTPLFSVISNFKDPEVIKMFVDAGASINEYYEDGRNILMLDICQCVVNSECVFKEIVNYCVNNGVNMRDVDKNGNSILHHTSCRYLINLASRRGVSFEVMNNLGQTALMQAVVKGECEKSHYFLLRGANVNSVDLDLNTPLHLIVSSRQVSYTTLYRIFSSLECVCSINIVLYHGANLFACNLANKSPVHVIYETSKSLYLYLSGYLFKDFLKHILLFDENKLETLRDIFEKYKSRILTCVKFNHFILSCREELDKLKSTYIKDDLTFYEFCILKQFYKNKYVDISVDEYKYNDEEIKVLFPIYEDLIIIRIKDNTIKRDKHFLRKGLRKCFENITLRTQTNSECNSDIILNYYCWDSVCRYLNGKEMYNLFSASISDS